jgi:hypothetical protein
MSTEKSKGLIELKVFSAFADRCGLPIVPGSAEKREPPEPDILCKLQTGETLAFELAEACAPEFAAAISSALQGHPHSAVWGDDVSEATIQKKLSNTYPVDCQVELLLYANGRTIMPDDFILGKIEPIVRHGCGQYRRIWFLGEGVHVVAQRGG